jgi:hypothetical protein
MYFIPIDLMTANLSQSSGFDVRYYECHDNAAPTDQMTRRFVHSADWKNRDELGVSSVALGASSAAIYSRI